MPPSRAPRIALYSHDGMGLGHLRRNALLAATLAEAPLGAAALLVAGARELGQLALPESVDCLTLPGFQKVSNGHYRPRRLDIERSRLVALRQGVLSAAMQAFDPDVLIVDKVPAGMYGELLPTLEELQARGTRLVLGLRDILDDPRQVRREWRKNGTLEVIASHYDAVWVYGDPAVYDLVSECGFPDGIRGRTAFTGYLDPRRHARPTSRGSRTLAGVTGADPSPAWPSASDSILPYTVCQVGGGEDGEALAMAFVDSTFPAGTRGVLLGGPYLPEPVQRKVRERARARDDLQVLGFVAGPLELVAGARQVISMGGYNSVLEVIATGRRSLVVPRVQPRQEQRIRAERMAALGLLDWLHPRDLTPGALSRWMTPGDAPHRPPDTAAPSLRLDGLNRIPQLLQELEPRGWSPPALPSLRATGS